MGGRPKLPTATPDGSPQQTHDHDHVTFRPHVTVRSTTRERTRERPRTGRNTPMSGTSGTPYAPHTDAETSAMLSAIGVDDEEALFDIPNAVAFDGDFGIESRSEREIRARSVRKYSRATTTSSSSSGGATTATTCRASSTTSRTAPSSSRATPSTSRRSHRDSCRRCSSTSRCSWSSPGSRSRTARCTTPPLRSVRRQHWPIASAQRPATRSSSPNTSARGSARCSKTTVRVLT